MGLCLALVGCGLSFPTLSQTAPSAGPPIGTACAYNSSLPTLSTGTAGWIQCDSNGRLLLSTSIGSSAATPVIATGLNATPVTLKASAGQLQTVHCDNGGTSSVYVEFFNATSPNLGTTAPTWVTPIPSGGGGISMPAAVALSGSAIVAVAVTLYNGSVSPSPTLTCAFGIQ